MENQNTNEVAEVATNEVAVAGPKPESIKKAYFPSTKMDAAQIAVGVVSAIAEEHELNMVFNFDVEGEFPAGYGLAIGPISKRENNENNVVGVSIAAIPDLATVEKEIGGSQFIHDAAIGSMIAKLANAVRPRGETGETASSIPFSVEDFITTNRPEGVLLAFNALAPAYVKVLKKKGLKHLTNSILRQVLQSAAFAEQQFPAVAQEKWLGILNSMVSNAEKDGLAVGLLAEWVKTRDSATLEDKDIDLSDLNFDDMVSTAAPAVAETQAVAGSHTDH
jgi:hypothetical protein